MSAPQQTNDQATPGRAVEAQDEDGTGIRTAQSPLAGNAQPSQSTPPGDHASGGQQANGSSNAGTAPAQPQPRPWQSAASSFFIFANSPESLAQFGLPASPRPRSSNPDTNADQQPSGNDAPAPQPGNTPPPPLANIPPGVAPFLSFLMPIGIFGPPPNRPDPAAAAELVRSLPTVSPELLKRIQRITIAEQVQDGEDEDNRGWKCAVCLEGIDPDEKETGVKALPCNHLFHAACIEPWFTSHHTW